MLIYLFEGLWLNFMYWEPKGSHSCPDCRCCSWGSCPSHPVPVWSRQSRGHRGPQAPHSCSSGDLSTADPGDPSPPHETISTGNHKPRGLWRLRSCLMLRGFSPDPTHTGTALFQCLISQGLMKPFLCSEPCKQQSLKDQGLVFSPEVRSCLFCHWFSWKSNHCFGAALCCRFSLF